MVVDIDINKVKNGSFLFKNEKGQIVSVTKEEILKEVKEENSNLKIENEQMNSKVKELEEKFYKQNELITKFVKVIGGIQ